MTFVIFTHLSNLLGFVMFSGVAAVPSSVISSCEKYMSEAQNITGKKAFGGDSSILKKGA